MKKLIYTALMALTGVVVACGQKNYEDADVETFANLIESENVILLDVRTPQEYNEGHIAGAINIDQAQGDFINKVEKQLSKDKTIAIYCRSGRRSANAARIMADEGFKCVNLKGGIVAWQNSKKPVTTDTYEIDIFKTANGKTIKIYSLMHACVRIVYEGEEIQIDPVRQLGSRTIDYSSMPKANYILVTHEHQDHYDKGAIDMLTGATTEFITNKRCAEMYGKGQVMVNGDEATISSDITIEAVPAYNTTEGREKFHPKGRDNGYILTLDGTRIYIAGDTEDIPEMANIKDIDIAFMPCNQPYTMTVEQLLKAARTVKPKVLFPYHFGQTDVSSVPAQLKNDGIEVRVRKLQ